MPRLDVWLIEQGHFSSRQAAKRAIKEGHVTVNGKPAKPSKQVSGNETIEVSPNSVDFPLGYSKMRQIDEILGGNILSSVGLALDIGSSAGGFLAYLAEHEVSTIGIEVSDDFIEPLAVITNRFPEVSVIMDDAFTIETSVICRNEELDLLLVDVTTDPAGTIRLIQRFKILLKKNGRLIAAFKTENSPEISKSLTKQVENLGFSQVKDIVLDKSRREVHITALRQ